MTSAARDIEEQLVGLGDPDAVPGKMRFFKAGPGGYAEGDRFLGVGVPQVRAVVKAQWRTCVNGNRATGLETVDRLLDSEWHEVRLAGAVLMVLVHERAEIALRSEVAELLARSGPRLNNWDLVDTCAPYVPGEWLIEHRGWLDPLASSPLLWDRRIAVISTFALIRVGSYADTLRLATQLRQDPEDLMHKACGWMLREVGKRDRAVLDSYLAEMAALLPRTTLRYAIEKHTPDERQRYLTAT